MKNNIRYQIPKSLLFSQSALALRLSPSNSNTTIDPSNVSQRRRLEKLLSESNLLDLSSAEKSKTFRV